MQLLGQQPGTRRHPGGGHPALVPLPSCLRGSPGSLRNKLIQITAREVCTRREPLSAAALWAGAPALPRRGAAPRPPQPLQNPVASSTAMASGAVGVPEAARPHPKAASLVLSPTKTFEGDVRGAPPAQLVPGGCCLLPGASNPTAPSPWGPLGPGSCCPSTALVQPRKSEEGQAKLLWGQGGWLGGALRRQVLGSAARGLLLGLGWDGAHMLGGHSGRGLGEALSETETRGTGTWGVAVGARRGGNRHGELLWGTGGSSMGREVWGCRTSLGHGERRSRAAHTALHESVGARVPSPWAQSLPKGVPSTAGPAGILGLPSQVPRCPDKGLRPQPPQPRGRTRPPEAEGAAPRVPGGCGSGLGCWCRSRSPGWLIPAQRGRSPW